SSHRTRSSTGLDALARARAIRGWAWPLPRVSPTIARSPGAVAVRRLSPTRIGLHRTHQGVLRLPSPILLVVALALGCPAVHRSPAERVDAPPAPEPEPDPTWSPATRSIPARSRATVSHRASWAATRSSPRTGPVPIEAVGVGDRLITLRA